MNVQTYRVKQYNSTYKTVVTVDGVPICILDGSGRTAQVIAYLYGNDDAEINDMAVKRKLDECRKEQSNECK